MADDSQAPNDSPSAESGSSTPDSSGQGFSIVKVLGIAVAMVGVAAAVIGFTFWQTLRDSASKEAVVLEGYGDPNDYEYPEEIAAMEEAASRKAVAQEQAAAMEAASEGSEESDAGEQEANADAGSEKADEPEEE